MSIPQNNIYYILNSKFCSAGVGGHHDHKHQMTKHPHQHPCYCTATRRSKQSVYERTELV